MKPTKIYSDTIAQAALTQFNAAMALPCVIQGALMPGAYKNIFEVMKLQEDLVEVTDRIIPLLNIKG